MRAGSEEVGAWSEEGGAWSEEMRAKSEERRAKSFENTVHDDTFQMDVLLEVERVSLAMREFSIRRTSPARVSASERSFK